MTITLTPRETARLIVDRANELQELVRTLALGPNARRRPQHPRGRKQSRRHPRRAD